VSTQREFKTNSTTCSPENQQKKKKVKLPVELLYFWTSANCSPKRPRLPVELKSFASMTAAAAAPRVRESSEALGAPTSTYRSTLKQQCIRTHVHSALIN